ncbi:ORF40 [callitrichine gammaherpesvirus 3]|uniref:ORF40 n=1 Tax=callitrichine gammaherpesvirus 3 TaxID=106331 RepID=Q993H0_9GAMA|nr:ORF40 [callitrichine gammaherpesvirus 3]AAK38248.1 ORF40 [callitrichine gammaherpesvirus 3]
MTSATTKQVSSLLTQDGEIIPKWLLNYPNEPKWVKGTTLAMRIMDSLTQQGLKEAHGPVFSYLFTLWNLLPHGARQLSKEKELIRPAVQALSTAIELFEELFPEESTMTDPGMVMRRVVQALIELWDDVCGCPECMHVTRGLTHLKPGLFQIPRTIPHTQVNKAEAFINKLVSLALVTGDAFPPNFDLVILVPDIEYLAYLEPSKIPEARLMLCCLYCLCLFFILRDHILQEIVDLRAQLDKTWSHAFSPIAMPPCSEDIVHFLKGHNLGGDNPIHHLRPELLPVPLHRHEKLRRRIEVVDPSLSLASHIVSLIHQGTRLTPVVAPEVDSGLLHVDPKCSTDLTCGGAYDGHNTSEDSLDSDHILNTQDCASLKSEPVSGSVYTSCVDCIELPRKHQETLPLYDSPPQEQIDLSDYISTLDVRDDCSNFQDEDSSSEDDWEGDDYESEQWKPSNTIHTVSGGDLDFLYELSEI